MKSQITVLGSGTCVPSLERNPCSFLMETGGNKLLFDCGPGVMRRLLEIDVSIFDISHIFLSHFHPDHSGELVSFLFALKYPAPSSQKQTLTIVAGQGFNTFFEHLQMVYGNQIVLPSGFMKVIELDTNGPDAHAFSGFSVASMPVAHRPESLAFRIVDDNAKVLVYSGDTDVCDGLVDIASHADLMICEAAFPDNQKISGHLTPSLAGEVARTAKVKQLMLTHFYPACADADIEKQCRRTFSGSLVLAQDMMVLRL